MTRKQGGYKGCCSVQEEHLIFYGICFVIFQDIQTLDVLTIRLLLIGWLLGAQVQQFAHAYNSVVCPEENITVGLVWMPPYVFQEYGKLNGIIFQYFTKSIRDCFSGGPLEVIPLVR